MTTTCPITLSRVRGFAIHVQHSRHRRFHYPARHHGWFTGEQAVQLMAELAQRGYTSVAVTDGDEIDLNEMKSLFPEWETHPPYRA